MIGIRVGANLGFRQLTTVHFYIPECQVIRLPSHPWLSSGTQSTSCCSLSNVSLLVALAYNVVLPASQSAKQEKQNWRAPRKLAYAYRLCLFLGKRSEWNTAYGMSLDLWTRVIPEHCAILKSVIISFAYNSFQTCSNSILTTVFSRKRMLHDILNYLWHVNKILVENFSHIFIHTFSKRGWWENRCSCKKLLD